MIVEFDAADTTGFWEGFVHDYVIELTCYDAATAENQVSSARFSG